MKINICTGPNFPVPPLQGGGMSRVWHGLAHVFADHGHEVTITARTHPQQPEQSHDGKVTISRYGGFDQASSLAVNLCKDFCYATSVAGQLPAADVTVINDFWLPALAPLLSKSPGKLVVSVNRMPKGQYTLYRKCDAFVCPNRQVADRLRQQTPQLNERIHIIPNPYDSSTFTANLSDRRGILYVGRIHHEKGLHLLMESFKSIAPEFPDVSLTVIGSAKASHGGGGNIYLNELKSLSADLPVHWHGPEYDTAKLRHAYQSHMLFVYPSLSEHGETFGIAPVEAMACGCVPITSQLDVFLNFIQPAQNGYNFPHRHPDAAARLAAVLSTALRNKNGIKDMSEQAVITARPYSMLSVGSRFLKCFDTLQAHT